MTIRQVDPPHHLQTGGRFDFSFRSSKTARLSQERQRALTDVTMGIVDHSSKTARLSQERQRALTDVTMGIVDHSDETIIL